MVTQMPQIEMQQAVERFTGEFLDKLAESFEPLTKCESVRGRGEALRRVLVYASSALDIASGPFPEVNVLDLAVFIRLSRAAFERHWLSEVFGEEARPVAEAFADAEARAWQLASKILTGQQRQELHRLIDAWTRAHPDQVRVEMVRFEEFSARAGELAEELQQNASGLLGSVKGAAQAADRALLLAERAMFLAHRLPFLIRLQARVGAQELLADSVARLEELDVLARLETSVDRMLRRTLPWLGLLGVVSLLSFGGGYYAVRRLSA